MMNSSKSHKILLQPVDSPTFLPRLRGSTVLDSSGAHWRQLFGPVNSKSKKVEKLTGPKTQTKVICWKTLYNERGLFSCYLVYMQNIFQSIPVSYLHPGPL